MSLIRVADLDRDEFNLGVYGAPTNHTIQYVKNQAQQALTGLANIVNPYATELFQKANARIEQVTSSDAMRRVRSIVRQLDGRWERDGIYECSSMGDLQNVGNEMLHYMAAEPTFRRLYALDMTEGWGDRLSDLGGTVNNHTLDYVQDRVIDGMYIEQEDGSYSHTQVYDSMSDGSDDLEIDQQDIILRSQLNLKFALLDGKEDPASPDNVMM